MTKIRRRTLLAYGSLGLPLAALGLPSYIFLPTFLAQDMGISLALVGLLFILARVWDMVTDPLIGRLSDGLPGGGRRKRLVALSLPVLAITTWLLFRPTSPLEAWQAGGLLFLFYLGWTMLAIPSYAWGAELSPDYDQKSRVTAYRESMVLAGTLLALLLPVVIPAPAGSSVAAHSLSLLAVAVAVLLLVTGYAALRYVPDPPPRQAVTPLPWRQQWLMLRANAGFWPLIRAYFFNGFANGLPGILFLLFAEHYLRLADEQAKQLLLVYFIAGIGSIPFWLWLSRRLDKHRAWQWSMALACGFFVCVPLVPAGGFLPFLVITLGTGLCVGADLILPASMQADVIHADTRQYGKPRAGLFFAWWGIVTKLSLALGSSAFIVLESIGFDASTDNSPAALTGLMLLYALVPVFCKLLALWQIQRFPLTRATVATFKAA